MDGHGYSPPTIELNKKGKNHRHAVVDDDTIKCSGKSCRSCSGGLIADCVAVCCCPCAVVNILALAFLKIPWMVGRKCLRMVKKKKLEDKKRKHDKSITITDSIVQEGIHVEQELKDSFSTTIDVDQIWLDLYQVGSMGFGRVSFTGTN